MDWFDEYLNELSKEYVVLVPPDIHYWGKKPPPNNTKKKLIFDSVADDEFRLRVAEERRKLEEHSGDSAYERVSLIPPNSIITFTGKHLVTFKGEFIVTI